MTKGIPMCTSNVLALLNTRFGEAAPIDPSKPFKSQTRRIPTKGRMFGKSLAKPFAVGDVLYVREGIRRAHSWNESFDQVVFVADGYQTNEQWRWMKLALPSIFMPRRLARIWLRVTRVWEEPLSNISHLECEREGYPPGEPMKVSYARQWFWRLWDELHGKGAWEQNPLVWVVEFVRIREDRA